MIETIQLLLIGGLSVVALLMLIVVIAKTARARRLPCPHPNLQTRKWLDDDNTPMMTSHCPDCGFYDSGHVYANPETWLNPEPKGDLFQSID